MDWIKAKTECSLEHVWVVIKERIVSDTEHWKTLQQPNYYKTNVTVEDDFMAVSQTDPFGQSIASVPLKKKSNAIEWKRKGDEAVHLLTCWLNAKGECRVLYEEQGLEFWQLSRLVLEPMLFP